MMDGKALGFVVGRILILTVAFALTANLVFDHGCPWWAYLIAPLGSIHGTMIHAHPSWNVFRRHKEQS